MFRTHNTVQNAPQRVAHSSRGDTPDRAMGKRCARACSLCPTWAGRILWHGDVECDEVVAFAVGVELGDAAVGKPHLIAGLRAFGNLGGNNEDLVNIYSAHREQNQFQETLSRVTNIVITTPTTEPDGHRSWFHVGRRLMDRYVFVLATSFMPLHRMSACGCLMLFRSHNASRESKATKQDLRICANIFLDRNMMH
jgi:hypothetical protein